MTDCVNDEPVPDDRNFTAHEDWGETTEFEDDPWRGGSRYRSQFLVISVATLPPVAPFHTDGPMPQNNRSGCPLNPQARAQPRSVSGCCWYHSGNWHGVNVTAIQLLTAAAARIPDDATTDQLDEVAFAITSAADTECVRGWERDALRSLFLDPIELAQDDHEFGGRPWYVNGRHRVQAMRDANVDRTIIRCETHLVTAQPDGWT